MSRRAVAFRVVLLAAASLGTTFGLVLLATRVGTPKLVSEYRGNEAAARGWPVTVDSGWQAPLMVAVSDNAIVRYTRALGSASRGKPPTCMVTLVEHGWPAGVLSRISVKTPDKTSIRWRMEWPGTAINLCFFALLYAVILLGVPVAWRWTRVGLARGYKRALQVSAARRRIALRVVLLAAGSIGTTCGLVLLATRVGMPPVGSAYHDKDAAARGWPVIVDPAWPAPIYWSRSENTVARYMRAYSSPEPTSGFPYFVGLDEYGWPTGALQRIHLVGMGEDSIHWRVEWLGAVVDLFFFFVLYAVVCAGVLLAWRWWRRALRTRRGLCPGCGYMLMNSDRCPECGWQAHSA